MRGRKPNPPPAARDNDDRAVTGTESVRATGGTASGLAEPDFRVLAMPDWGLGQAEIASAQWRALEAELAALGVLGPENAPILEMACVQYAKWKMAEAQVARLGPILRAPGTGVAMHNPYLSVANAAADRYIKLAAELGLTPAMRGRVTKRKVPTIPGKAVKVEL